MGWRNIIVFKPLIGEQLFISKFKENTEFEEKDNDCWKYEQFNFLFGR